MVPKKASLDGKSRQEAYGSIGSKSEITSNCRPASATGTEARLEEIVLTLELVVGATMLLQPRSKAGIFIGLPIPIPVPVFYGPAYYPPGYYYGPYYARPVLEAPMLGTWPLVVLLRFG
jgi:hypothetical protein